jgi:hypothetical protein
MLNPSTNQNTESNIYFSPFNDVIAHFWPVINEDT